LAGEDDAQDDIAKVVSFLVAPMLAVLKRISSKSHVKNNTA
jgi:hypothetical protein